MSNTCDYFVYLKEQQLLVCRSCKYCLQLHGIERHLRWEHQSIPLLVRKELVNYMKSLAVINSIEVIIPIHSIPALDVLEIINRFCCMICKVLYGVLASMRVHWSSAHKGVFKESKHIL